MTENMQEKGPSYNLILIFTLVITVGPLHFHTGNFHCRIIKTTAKYHQCSSVPYV